MKVKLVDETGHEDVFHPPEADAPDRGSYSEWHHFNLNDAENGLYAIYNLALSGDVNDPLRTRAGVSLVVYQRGFGWHGTTNLYALADARFAAGDPDLQIGENAIQFDGDRYRVSGNLRDGSVGIDATVTPRSAPVRIDNIGGLVSSFMIPRLVAQGELRLAGETFRFDRATCYHDHNWGHWQWGQDIGWDWGFLHQAEGSDGGQPLSLVFGKVTDAGSGTDRSDLVLLTWLGQGFSQVFLDRAVTLHYAGELDPAQVRRVPGVVDLIDPRRPTGIPRYSSLQVEEGDDRLEIRFEAESALQFLIPHPEWRQRSVITELVGEYCIEGVLGDRDLNFSFFGFAEIAG